MTNTMKEDILVRLQNGENAEEVWNLCNEKLQNGMSAREMMRMANVTLIATTDDPADTLEWHKKIQADDSFDVIVAPTFRPDKALNIEKEGWIEYLDRLAEVTGVRICSVTSSPSPVRINLAASGQDSSSPNSTKSP